MKDHIENTNTKSKVITSTYQLFQAGKPVMLIITSAIISFLLYIQGAKIEEKEMEIAQQQKHIDSKVNDSLKVVVMYKDSLIQFLKKNRTQRTTIRPLSPAISTPLSLTIGVDERLGEILKDIPKDKTNKEGPSLEKYKSGDGKSRFDSKKIDSLVVYKAFMDGILEDLARFQGLGFINRNDSSANFFMKDYLQKARKFNDEYRMSLANAPNNDSETRRLNLILITEIGDDFIRLQGLFVENKSRKRLFANTVSNNIKDIARKVNSLVVENSLSIDR